MKRLARDEKGQTMLLAVILLLVGGLIVSSLLAYMGTGLLTGRVYEKRTAELYAADAGVEDAVWKVQHKDDADANVGYVPCTPGSDPRIYNITANNQSVKNVVVNITCVANTTGYLWKITSIATTSGNSHTTIESYVKFTTGAELNIFSGALASQTGIDLGRNSTVNGDIYHCGAFDNSTIVNNNWTDKGCAPFPNPSENQAFAKAFEDAAKKGGTYNGTMTISSNTNLGPKYITGDLYIQNDVIVTINGTVYVKGSITAKKDFTLAGSGSIVAEGDIYISKIAGFGTAGDSLIMSLNGNIEFKKEGTINALVYAPNGAIKFDKAATVIGGVVGKSIQADKDGAFTFVPKTSWDFPGALPGSLEIKTYNISQ
jgi:hypothetical protein